MTQRDRRHGPGLPDPPLGAAEPVQLSGAQQTQIWSI
jgi:hypothetical protein